MKVLLDACVSGGARHELRSAGHDVVWVGDEPGSPGDDEILTRASQESRVLVTLDKDFGELAIVYERPHSGIVRLVGFSARRQGTILVRVLAEFSGELEAGAIVTAEPGRIRIRSAAGEGTPPDRP
jgi:predicted nuclease of predicted toxin-antitoxin system